MFGDEYGFEESGSAVGGRGGVGESGTVGAMLDRGMGAVLEMMGAVLEMVEAVLGGQWCCGGW